MKSTIVLEVLQQMGEIPQEEEQAVLENFKERNYKTKEYLLNVGDVCNKIFFVESGLVRMGLIDMNSEDITFKFRMPHQFVTDYESFLLQQPATYSLQALENTRCFEIEKDAFDKMIQMLTHGEFFNKKIVEGLYLEYKQRLLSFYRETPEERYLKIFEKMPSLINRIPQNYLASYIGVTPQSFSRIKRRYMENQRKTK